MKFVTRPFFALKPVFSALLFFPSIALAAGSPDAGSILQQVQPVTPPKPSSTGTGLKIEQGRGAKLPPSAPFEVRTIEISGNTLFDTATLHALVADGEGKSLTLTQLEELAARITDYYHSHGYPLARAFIPAQTIQSGVVRIEIMEARYGKINLENHSQVNDSLLGATLSPLQSGQAISQTGLDQSLLLLSDIPGVAINATLKPGEAVGTSDLLVGAAPGPATSGSVMLDNYGNRYTGRARAGATANYYNPFHHGDYFGFSGLTSGSGLNYGRLNYETLLSGRGTRLGGAYSSLHYALGDTLESLNAHGTADVASLWLKHPVMRSRNVNFYAQIQYDQKKLRDHIDSTSIQTDRHLDNWTLSLSGDARNALLSDSVTTWNVSWTSGQVGFDNVAAQQADAATAKTEGNFSKWNVNLAYLQSLSTQNALYLTFAGQAANGNLDSSEKMTVGGPYSVRAYDMGAMSGDVGYQLSAEVRHDLGEAWQGRWQTVAFVDNAYVTINKNTWVAGENTATLTGAGLGLNWAGINLWSARAYAARRVGSTPSQLETEASARAWIEVSKGF